MSDPITAGGVHPNDADLDGLMAELADLDIEEIEVAAEDEAPVEEPVIEEIVEPSEPVIDEHAESLLEADLVRAESYEASEAGDAVEAIEEGAAEASAETATEKPKRAKKAKDPSAPKKERIERDLSALPDDAFIVFEGDTATSTTKTTLLAKRPSQKKIAEKFDQTIAALHAGRKPSVYVEIAFKLLDDKKELTSTDLVAALRATDRKSGEGAYNEGTARSQAGQIMALFPALEIAERSGQKLSLVTNSAFAAKLRKVLAA